jgi:hypothetical protein
LSRAQNFFKKMNLLNYSDDQARGTTVFAQHWRFIMHVRSSAFLALSAVASAMLVACGGGSGSTNSEVTTPDSAATSASAAIASTMGASLIGTGVYDLVADIGDTWKITLNTSSNTFDLQVVQTVYGLANTSGTITVGNKSGTRTTYTLSAGNTELGTLTTDSSTQTIAGNLKLGNKVSSVSGSAYKATALSKLAGTYNFMQAARDAVSGNSPDFALGQVQIAADGSSAQLCRSGKFVGSVCTSVAGSQTETASTTLSLDSTTGQILFKDFGRAAVVASDLGKAMVLDMARTNAEGFLRSGVFYLTEAKPLSETAINGNWNCSQGGATTNALTITGTTGTSTGMGPVTSAKFKYNNLNHTDNSWIGFDGFAAGGASTDAVADYSAVLPVSSTLMVMEADQRIRICHKSSNS